MLVKRVLAVSLAVILSHCAPTVTHSPNRRVRPAAVSSTKVHRPKKVKLTPEAIRYIKAVQRAQLLAYLHALWLGETAATRACIKSYESGNYTESTHPGSGSGAYQFTPDTWRHYFGLWKVWFGYAFDHDLAYMAPDWVQDDVAAYALTNGGAHNWDPSYGNDPCTVSLP